MSISVVVFIYKRHNNFNEIVSSLHTYAPSRIYIVADGPKIGEEGDCDRTRHKLEELIDWPCQVHKNYSQTNLGLKERFRTGMDWVFSHEDRAIIIEDDCVPHPSFFLYCEELLEKYQDDSRIASISGNNFLFGRTLVKDSYYFSRYPLIWGWATWRRAWQGYDSDLKSWTVGGNNSWLSQYLVDFIPSLYWRLIFDLVKTGKIRTWDYQFTYHCFRRSMLHIIPQVNMVTNLGDDGIATNTKVKTKTIGLRRSKISFPLQHPRHVVRHIMADKITEKTSFITPIIATSLVIKFLLSKVERFFYVR